MRRLLSFLLVCTTVQIVHTSCPDGFELAAGGQCNKLYGPTILLPVNKSISTAIAKCKELHAQPIIIHNEEQNSYWAARYRGYFTILGIMCNTVTGKWEWSDGSIVDYKPAYFLDLDENCTTGWAWYINSNSYWSNVHDFDASMGCDIYCTTQLPPLPVPSADGCETFEDDSEDGVCYQVGASAENWKDAQLICRKLGANLASIHNQQENSFIRRLAVAKGAITGLYLGATLSGKGNNFGWIDGSEWDYDNFAPGFPRTGFGDCIAMDTSTSTGQWINTECSAKLPVACIREQKPVVAPTCSSETITEGTVVTSPGFPFTASTPCDYYLTVGENKRVEVEILLLEANSCCDSLILYDGHIGGIVLANLTGEVYNATYTTTSVNTMKVSWLPKGGVNVMGMALTFRGV